MFTVNLITEEEKTIMILGNWRSLRRSFGSTAWRATQTCCPGCISYRRSWGCGTGCAWRNGKPGPLEASYCWTSSSTASACFTASSMAHPAVSCPPHLLI